MLHSAAEKKKKKSAMEWIPTVQSWGSAPPRSPEGWASAGGIGLRVSALLVEGCPLEAKSLHQGLLCFHTNCIIFVLTL